MPDPFTTLPAPLPLMIIEEIEDLPTLHHLLQASPTASSIFSRDYARIIEGVVARYSAWVQGPISVVLRLHDGDGESLLRHTRSEENLDSFLKEHFPCKSLPPQSIAKRPRSLSSARSLLRTAITIQKLAGHFLKKHLQRTHTVMSSWLTKLDQQGAWNHCGTPRHTITADSSQWRTPSWIEEQRVLKSIWRLQLYIDLLAMRLRNTTAPFDDPVAKLLRHRGPTRLYLKLLAYSEILEMNYIQRCISTTFYDLDGSEPGDPRNFEVLPWLDTSSVSTPVPFQEPGEEPHFWMPADKATAQEAPGAQFLLRAYRRYNFLAGMSGVWSFRCLGDSYVGFEKNGSARLAGWPPQYCRGPGE